QQPHVHWLEQAYGERVTISIANPTLKSTVAIMQWESENDVPIAIDIPSLETVRCEVERAPIFDSSIFGPTTIQSQSEWLSIMLGGHTTTLPIVPAEVIAQPPSVLLQTLHPLWTLQSIQSGRPNRVNPSLETSVQIRKLLGSWELFVQCSGNNSPTPFPEKIISPADVRGIEAITILHPNSQAIVCISPAGGIAGISIPNNIEVHTASSETGWIARIVIPEVWIDDERFSFSAVRTHGDSTQVETGPLPCVPWSIKPSPVHIDLSTWDNVGKFPISLPIQ
ncbi:MAG: hypothetical protein VX436_00275, partial [Planctomycetota bacterium]|nr:hypothetical protein [Planctomycetota bacterium]